MSLQTRLSALITAIGTDIKALQARTPTILGEVSSLSNTSQPTKAVEWWNTGDGTLIAKLAALTKVENAVILNRTELWARLRSRTNDVTIDKMILDSNGLSMLVPPLVTALPTTGPGTNSAVADGQECVYVDATNGVMWHLKYRAADSKWYFIGGAPVSKLQAADLTTITSTTFVTDANSPSYVLPFAGDYDVTFSSGAADISVAGQQMWVTAATSIAGATDARSARQRDAQLVGLSRTIRLTSLAAGATLAMYARVTANTGRTFDRSMHIQPVRIS